MVKRLVKSDTDKKLFGVASGVADYFDIDPTLVRVGFVVLCILCPLTFVAYLAMAVLMPSPTSGSQETSVGQAPEDGGGGPTEEGQQRHRSNVFGWGFVAVGGLIAAAKLNIFPWPVWGLGFAWSTWGLLAVALIGVGVVLLARGSRTT